jgi:hypothetical protein
MADEPKRTEKLTVAIYWPSEGYGMGQAVPTMEAAHVIAKQEAANGYGRESTLKRKTEIHIIRTVREVTVWSEDDPVG